MQEQLDNGLYTVTALQCNYEVLQGVLLPRRELKYTILKIQNIFEPCNSLLHNLVMDRKCLIIVDEHYCSQIKLDFCDKIACYFKLRMKNVYITKSIDLCFDVNNLDFEGFDIFICTSNPVAIDGGERKTIDSVENIIDYALKYNLPRNGLLIGIGGGVTLDTVGLAASLYRRMINYIRIPTTLVGQIDAGLGVKVGVNYRSKKNFLGTFYPPTSVIIDPTFLTTLPPLQVACGIAEMIKIGVTHDERVLTTLEDFCHHSEFGVASPTFFSEMVSSHRFSYIADLAASIMIDEISRDPFETDTCRKVDFGHTFSQSFETFSSYEIPHGIAVAIDMFLSVCISHLTKLITAPRKQRLLNIISCLVLPFVRPDVFSSINPKELFVESVNHALGHRGSLNLVVPAEGKNRVVFINLSSNFSLIRADHLFVSQEILDTHFQAAFSELLNLFHMRATSYG